jgi:hypothetical protein
MFRIPYSGFSERPCHREPRAGAKQLADKQWATFEKAIAADEADLEVYVACGRAPNGCGRPPPPERCRGRRIAEQILISFPTCPIPKIKRLGRTLKRWARRHSDRIRPMRLPIAWV